MVEEGSVIVSPQQPLGSAADVAPEGFPHPVYRSGFALSIALPVVNFGRAEEVQSDTELAEALDEALKAAALAQPESESAAGQGETEHESQPEPEPEPDSVGEIVTHTPVEQEAPQTAFDEPPTAPAESELPERLNVEQPPAEETHETNTSHTESTEPEPGDEI
jgi:hypothetical protein